LEFHDVLITAKLKTSLKQKLCRKGQAPTHKIILDNISGKVSSGEFLSIIGASGAGKTTLLNYLSGKDKSRNLRKSGYVTINNVDRRKVAFSKFTAFVQ
jgi:ABC-type multidrug transport system ATPase subunit